VRTHTAKCGTQFSQVIARTQRGGASPGAGGARRRSRRTLKYGGRGLTPPPLRDTL